MNAVALATGIDGYTPAESTTGLRLEEARLLIGRRLVLLAPIREFAPGTRCVVMCAVDFGDGLLLWVTTDDQRLDDVDQFTPTELARYFELTDARSEVSAAGARSAVATRTVLAPATMLRRALNAADGFVRAWRNALRARDLADHYWQLSDDQLAARGLGRDDISSKIIATLDAR